MSRQGAVDYNAPFAKLCKELFHARAEANDNVKFLAPLRKWVEQLEDCTDYSVPSRKTYPPVVHTILLIWKGSATTTRRRGLVVLVREVCNALVAQSQQYLGTVCLSSSLSSQKIPMTREAVMRLKETLRVFGAFKEVYFKYKDKAATECPLNAWRVQNNAVFVRLDAFWERCHDVLELTETTMQFGQLAKIEIGGTKGKCSRRRSCRSTRLYQAVKGSILWGRPIVRYRHEGVRRRVLRI